MRLNAPVFSTMARRVSDTEVKYEIAGERVDYERTGDLEADVEALTADLAQRLGRQIRIAPGQYFWLHRRWKSWPADETADDDEED